VKDVDIICAALREIHAVLAEHLVPGLTSPSHETVNKIFDIVDRPEVTAAQDRIERGYGRSLYVVE
jgi:hypothetical protein